ncbi:MAG: hypothetical protein JSS02_28005 [Planctomycetes bacterium]|nr:hypothetical protein [Planctomycetota bacterium]
MKSRENEAAGRVPGCRTGAGLTTGDLQSGQRRGRVARAELGESWPV